MSRSSSAGLFAIDGEFELDVFPSVSVLAERVRIGNAESGTKPRMLEVGRFSTQVGLWSLISGPVDVRSFELADVSVLLERNREGADNWTLSEADESEEEDSLDPGVTEFPVVVQHAKLNEVEIIYREPGAPDRVALLVALTIEPGTDGLLAVAGNGKLDAYRTKVNHTWVPSMRFSGRNIRMKMQAAIEKLQLDIHGSLGRLRSPGRRGSRPETRASGSRRDAREPSIARSLQPARLMLTFASKTPAS